MIKGMFNASLKTFGLLLAGLMAFSTNATVYRCTDPAGHLTLQDRACVPGTTLSGGSVDIRGAGSRQMLMWRVTGPQGSAWLVGSIHFGVPGMYPLPAAMTGAFQSAEVLVVEVDLTKLGPEDMAQAVAEEALYPADKTLSQSLSPTAFQELNKVLAEFDVPPSLVEHQKPWFVAMTLTTLELRRFDFDEALGIDNHFMNLARGTKPIRALEGFRQQLEFLNNFSAADQEAMLRETFEDLKKGRAFLAETVAAWQSGDTDKIDELMNRELRNGSAADRRMYQVLVVQRNHTMTDAIDQLLAHGGSYFVVLGAAHFVGDDGIVAALRRRGYHVEKY